MSVVVYCHSELVSESGGEERRRKCHTAPFFYHPGESLDLYEQVFKPVRVIAPNLMIGKFKNI